MKNLTLRQLRYFEALARHGHFGRAAAACSISQPALSVQIRDLEADLGAPLFERGARQVRLTALGEACLSRAVEILRAVDEFDDLARAAQGDLVGRLRLGVIPTVAPYLLPALFAELNRNHVGLDLHVRETLTPRLLGELHEGKIDAAILALPVGEAGLHEVALFDESFVFVRPEAEANAPVPDGEALQKMRLLLLEEGHCFRDQALSFCKLSSATPRDGLDGSSLTTLVQMVGAGLGVTLIPEMAVPVETPAARVSIARFAEPQPTRTIGMVWRNSSPLSEQFRHFSETVRSAAMVGRLART
ncbi:hydrogen peroxide-inducible genes activator [Mameliella sp. CS4]|uniref:hydrogen peroxide-inducible genes activator n=1 Tax=Mameliella sp. CS4 TaxID=2862329 RepID=UPI001C5F9B40|nr:hydrogen peroxide-inducible genes activator [Mameliella sp. CS4]MBW4985593.1 hydrogen peroxide-inducible genes activator [Mameliella sp. CS4]